MPGRRDVLKLAAFSALASAAGLTIGCAHTSDASTANIIGGANAMKSRPLMTVRIAASPAQKFGTGPHGVRMMFPVTGGDFEGPRLRGRILPGGGNWVLLRSDGVLELDLRITLQTDDGVLIYMTFVGLRHGPPDAVAALGRGEEVDPSTYYFRTVPRFETAAPKYDFLNRLLAIGISQTRPTGAEHEIEELL
jgi:Protein of unknown function (DUF3237)